MPALHDCGTELNPCQGFGGSDHATIKTWFLGQNQESVSVDFWNLPKGQVCIDKGTKNASAATCARAWAQPYCDSTLRLAPETPWRDGTKTRNAAQNTRLSFGKFLCGRR